MYLIFQFIRLGLSCVHRNGGESVQLKQPGGEKYHYGTTSIADARLTNRTFCKEMESIFLYILERFTGILRR
jgi:hypothetical protein